MGKHIEKITNDPSLDSETRLDSQLKENGELPADVDVYTLDDAVDAAKFGTFQRRLLCLSGLVWAADAIEIVILSVIGQYLARDWKIFRWQSALLTSGVFAGMSIGCPVFGKAADVYGRKKTIFVSVASLFVFGALSAASPSYYWMLASRSLTGFSLGGVAQVLTLCSEYFPRNLRGRGNFYLCYFWAIGTFTVSLLSWAIMMTTDNWRLLLAVAALPAFIALLFIKWYPESARYYLVSNNFDAAQKILSQMAEINGKELPRGRLLPVAKCSDRGRIGDLFIPEYRISTLLFWYMTCAAAFCYYGIIFISPTIVANGNIYSQRDANFSSFYAELTEYVPYTAMTADNYIDLTWTSAAEMPGLILFTFLVERIDRKKLLFGGCFLSGILTFLMLIPNPRMLVLVCLFAARGILLAVFQLLFVMVSEFFPTTLRATALGTASGWARIGGLTIPYVAQVMINSDPVAAVSVLGCAILLAALASLFLPLETRGAKLADTHVNAYAATQDSSHL